MNIDQNLIEKAGECGLRPLLITLGALKDYEVTTDLKSYEGPFGVGYGVASFTCEEDTDD
jgi:aromatic ring-opening dioxygenase LigB subunit